MAELEAQALPQAKPRGRPKALASNVNTLDKELKNLRLTADLCGLSEHELLQAVKDLLISMGETHQLAALAPRLAATLPQAIDSDYATANTSLVKWSEGAQAWRCQVKFEGATETKDVLYAYCERLQDAKELEQKLRATGEWCHSKINEMPARNRVGMASRVIRGMGLVSAVRDSGRYPGLGVTPRTEI
jgi:hypothetical protein